jgi:hypothetical protein
MTMKRIREITLYIIYREVDCVSRLTGRVIPPPIDRFLVHVETGGLFSIFLLILLSISMSSMCQDFTHWRHWTYKDGMANTFCNTISILPVGKFCSSTVRITA